MRRRLSLTEADRERIQQAVVEAEKFTSGEIVPVVLESSDAYERATWIWATLGGVLGSGALLAARSWLSHVSWHSAEEASLPVEMLIVQVLGTLIGVGMSRVPYFRRLVLSREKLVRTESARTKQLFVDHGLTRTRDRTGVLVVVSLFEHRVEILADEGIHREVPEGYWKNEVDALALAIRQGRFVDGLCSVISDIGTRLAAKFPRNTGDINELSDSPREGS